MQPTTPNAMMRIWVVDILSRAWTSTKFPGGPDWSALIISLESAQKVVFFFFLILLRSPYNLFAGAGCFVRRIWDYLRLKSAMIPHLLRPIHHYRHHRLHWRISFHYCVELWLGCDSRLKKISSLQLKF